MKKVIRKFSKFSLAAGFLFLALGVLGTIFSNMKGWSVGFSLLAGVSFFIAAARIFNDYKSDKADPDDRSEV